MERAERLQMNGGDDEMKFEFTSFCRVLLRLLLLGKTDEAIKELQTIIKNGEK